MMHVTTLTAFTTLILLRVANSKPDPDTQLHTCSTNLLTAFQTVGNSSVDVNTDPLEPLENAKLSAINTTSYDNWQFEAISPDGTQGLALYFFRDSSFAQQGQGNLWVEVMAVWSNGTQFNTTIFVNESSVEVCDRQTTGKWRSTGIDFTFKIPKSLDKAEIALFSPQISGNFSLYSKAPAHYPDGALYPSANASVSLAPFLYWTDPIPSGKANARLNIDNRRFSITNGSGGHDRSFSPFRWNKIAKYFYSVRFITGPYTLRYYEWQSSVTGTYYISAFLAKHGKKIFSATHGVEDVSGSFAVFRPYQGPGVHGSFGDDNVGWEISLVDTKENKRWYFVEQHRNILFEGPPSSDKQRLEYTRFVGTTSGGGSDGRVYRGVSIGEQTVIRELS